MKRSRGLAAWLAIVALSLNALWPLLAQAKPRSVTLVPVCTVGGETHYVELETGGTQAPSHAEHCPQCPMGTVALPVFHAAELPSGFPLASFTIEESFVRTPSASIARSRAPPAGT